MRSICSSLQGADAVGYASESMERENAGKGLGQPAKPNLTLFRRSVICSQLERNYQRPSRNALPTPACTEKFPTLADQLPLIRRLRVITKARLLKLPAGQRGLVYPGFIHFLMN